MNDTASDRALSVPRPAAHDASRNRALGARGEAIAAAYLEDRGCRVLERNWRNGGAGELDLIVRDGDAVVAVEVKTRSGVGFGHPLEAVTATKARRLRRLLIAWTKERRPRAERLRIDAVGIVLRGGERPDIHHLRGIG
ncbi:YraN family protein [Leucobacter weissii]|uniref:UPF0102 protein J4H92_04295 n=1 Tax=Leucobacter weissii TaxID=1983706 RepID=A0A939SB94_9MICO|nr:YraN family protein [Leucobacter weissii]MBO1901168.1 YraN family protein [Leucobacter weissii]